MIKSFRLKLTAWYLLFFILVFVVFSFSAYNLLAGSLHQRLDDSLHSAAATGIAFFEEELSEERGNSLVAAHSALSELHMRGLLVAIFEGSSLLAASGLVEPSGLADLAHQAARVGKPQVRKMPEARSSGVEALAHPFLVDNRQFVFLAAGSLDPIADDLALLRRVTVIALPILALMVGFGGYWLATRSLAPVRRMAEQARGISERNLQGGLQAGAASEEFQLLADSFNALLKRLDQAFAAMRRFVADASHELRTPLAVIRGEADVALSMSRSAAEYRESLTIVQDEARRLSRLAEDLLNLARADAESAELRVEPLYLNDLLADCCRAIESRASAKGIVLECRCPEDVPFRGDQELLRRLVLNLLENAIRYTPAGGKISASLEPGESTVRMDVSDTGIGITPEAAPHVFERFYRADQARSREQGGFGLGLAIVKWIAESHHGTVELSSQPGVGSTFTVLLRR
jgi:heavy metal sensor kinase